MTYQKEKLIDLTKRVYRLTLLFPKKEPLRYKIREIADEILAGVISFRYENPVRDDPKPILKNFEILDSFLELAKEQNWVSPKEILETQSEYKKLLNELFSPGQAPAKPTKLNERQKKILEILKEKGKIQVWQVKEIFPNVSKRTLRRDFQSLLKMGKIERIGERTNTFYKLK